MIRALALESPSLKIVDASERLGAAYARNVGAKHASADLLIFLDSDDVIEPGWLNAYLAAAGPECLLTGPIDTLKLATYPPWGAAASRLRPSMTFRGQPFAISANCAVSRSLFERVGGFQSDLGGTVGEDVEFSWHVESLGFPLQFVPGAIVLKRPRVTRREMFAQWSNYAMSSANLHHRYPERTRWTIGSARWTPTRQESVQEMMQCLAHPVRHQGVFIQLAGLIVGRIRQALLSVRH